MPQRQCVIIIAQQHDIHALAVAAEVGAAFNQHAVILDSADYPQSWGITLTYGPDQEPAWRVHSPDWQIDSPQLAGVWWRRPRRHRIAPEIKGRKERRFCLDEARVTFQGWLDGLGARVINQLAAEYAAIHKPFQLLKAREAGLKIPRTVITNNPDEVRRFLQHLEGAAVFKVLTGTAWQFTETRSFLEEYSQYLESLRYAPAIFQELVEAELDIRTTIIDETVFSAAIRPVHPGARLDWRMDGAAEIQPHDMPPEIERKLIIFLRSLGLRFGAIDLRLTPEKEYVFLEVNPAGQFLFCEIHAGQPISRQLAASLLQGPPGNYRKSIGNHF